MNIPEAIVSRVYYTKYGERIVSFKSKKEDRAPESDKYFEECWEHGTLLAVATAPFQSQEVEYMPEEKKEREKTVYERLRWEVVKDFPDAKKQTIWNNYKWRKIEQLDKSIHPKDYSAEAPASQHLWTPEEAEKLILQFQGKL